MKYVAKVKNENKMILESWVNKFSDLPENKEDAENVAKMLGFKNDEFSIKMVSEKEYLYMKGLN